MWQWHRSMFIICPGRHAFQDRRIQGGGGYRKVWASWREENRVKDNFNLLSLKLAKSVRPENLEKLVTVGKSFRKSETLDAHLGWDWVGVINGKLSVSLSDICWSNEATPAYQNLFGCVVILITDKTTRKTTFWSQIFDQLRLKFPKESVQLE